ncbi:hypothetical protein BT93_L5046 [Corymbia citriodora subsp. variegata]|uniref:NB-ARC domain-containing protein n=1 Tax=Corymbia citriodora subsp. variegata TaxID=360336 RepID=A0A8T0CT41_CORYI|nr:hypothetical protein BT93_L5046 [Corymbia citriodora subsp. variegata]
MSKDVMCVSLEFTEWGDWVKQLLLKLSSIKYIPLWNILLLLENVRERSSRKEGIVQLQKNLLYEIVGSRFAENIQDTDEGMATIGEILCNRKVLVVLDDVDKSVSIKNLIGNFKLHKGSRIIVTTREEDILEVRGFEGEIRKHEMQKMKEADALQLFCRHAFDRDSPLNDYHELSNKIVAFMEGLPLAMEVVGSSLRGKDKHFWKETLDKLRDRPEKAIREKLLISYDDLEKGHKQMFLDIACFLFNEKKTDAMYIWDQCQFYPHSGIDDLKNRCLIKILDDDQFYMHKQLRELGRYIVRQETSNLEEQSRLWVAEDALKIIKTKKMKDKVEAIKMDELNKSIEITNKEFKRLQNLRLLKLGNGTYGVDFAKYCSKLGWISCHSPNWDLRGDNMNLNNLLVFKLHDTGFMDDAKAWDLIKSARNLKVLSLTQCNGITTIPDFSNCSGLEKLTLAHCDRLQRIESFIENLESLIELEIECCKSLTDLPKEMGALVKLKRFSLRECSGLRKLPCSLGNLTSLIELDLSETGIAELPNSMKGLLKVESFLLTDMAREEFPKFIEKLRSLRVLSLPKNGSYSPEHHVWQLPNGIGMLKILEELDISGRDEMTSETPVGIGDLSSFTTLNLTSTQICNIPRNIDMLDRLQTLNLRNHNEIQGLSEFPSRTINMIHRQASSPPEVTYLPRRNLKTLEHHPSSLLRLDLICPSFSLAKLLPSSLILRNLTTLEFYYVKVEGIPLDRLVGLESLIVHSCELLQSLSISSEHLRQAHLSYCPDLVDVSFSILEKLESFFIFGCDSLDTINWLECLRSLEKLEIQQCNELTEVRGLEHLESLKSLEVTQCPSLKRLIDASCTNIPDDCFVKIQRCGVFFKDSTPSSPPGMPLSHYISEILLDTSNKEIQDEHSHVPNFPNVANQPPAYEDDSYGVRGSVNRPLKQGEQALWGDGNRRGGGSAGEIFTSLVLPDEEEKRKRESFFIESLQGKASLESNSNQGVRATGDYHCHVQAHYEDANEIEMRKNKRVWKSSATAVAVATEEEAGEPLVPSPSICS